MKSPSLYYRAPEGEDLPGKLSYALSRSAIVGTAVGFFNSRFVSTTKPQTVLQTLGRIAYWNVPFAAISTGFVATTYILTNLRKKDDQLNYVLGGLMSGSIAGTLSKNVGFGFCACAVFAFSGMLKKMSLEEGWEFIPETKRQSAGIFAPKFDFTLTPEIKGNWTRGEE